MPAIHHAIETARAAAVTFGSSPAAQDLNAELTDALDLARDLVARIAAADAEWDARVEGFLARNDARRSAA
jgi:hypothetical protein